MHELPGMQSLSVWHGQAHFCAATLQRWVRQLASLVHGKASGLGVESGAPVTLTGAACAGDAASVGACVVPSVNPGVWGAGAT